ncbi:MAG: class I SAM-dependent methyltransferase [Dehalococcoidales bacterium]|nr:class I SAM-dependent methyltransferase [Dehalococcoidales bacterium]
MGVKEFYEEMYGDQPRSKPKLSYLYRKLRRFELNRYDITERLAPGGVSLLDIGCGDGELLCRLKDKYQELWGIDIAEPRIDRIKKRLEQDCKIHVRVEDTNEKLNFADSSFDTITVVSVLEHVFDPYHLIRECHRLLRPGGTLIVQVPNVAWFPNRIRMLLGKLPVTSDESGWDGGHLHYFTVTSLKNLFRQEGLEVIKVDYSGIFASVRKVWGPFLGGDIVAVGIKR